MAAATGKNRNRQPRPDGLVAAYGFVLALTAVCAIPLFDIGGDPPQVVPRAEAAQSTLALPLPPPPPPTPTPKPIGSLKLPPRPAAASDFRVLPAGDRAELAETAPDGQRLPKISSSGWMPWIAFARRYSPEGSPARIGLLMINVGIDDALTTRAIDELPGEVSLAFLPGTPDLPRWLQRARAHGHESYLMLPVEDPGGLAERGIKPIEASTSDAENLRRLQAAMARGEGYVGFVVPASGPVSRSKQIMRPLVQEIADRGVAIVEIGPATGTSPIYRLTTELGVGYARSSSVLDYKFASQSLDTSLDALADWVGRTAADRVPRHAFGVMQPSAAAIAAVVAWRQRVAQQKTVSLVPIIGHFECRDACMARVRALPAQLQP